MTRRETAEASAARWEQVEVVERAGPDGVARFTGRLVLPVAKGDRAGRRRGRVVWLSAPAVEVLRELEPAPGCGLVFPPPALLAAWQDCGDGRQHYQGGFIARPGQQLPPSAVTMPFSALAQGAFCPPITPPNAGNQRRA